MRKKLPPRGRGRPGITIQDVEKAVTALRAQGRSIGQTNVRLELGRGSRTTITEFLRELGLSKPRDKRRDGRSEQDDCD